MTELCQVMGWDRLSRGRHIQTLLWVVSLWYFCCSIYEITSITSQMSEIPHNEKRFYLKLLYSFHKI